MYRSISRIFAVLAVVLFPLATQAEDSERVYTQGTVWSVGYVETKPGHFDDYLKDLSMVWKAYLDQQKKDGLVVSYQVLNVVSTRDDEPDLLLLVEFPNWAAFDKADLEYFDGIDEKIQGSVSASLKASVDRGSLRNLRGGLLAQELKFK